MVHGAVSLTLPRSPALYALELKNSPLQKLLQHTANQKRVGREGAGAGWQRKEGKEGKESGCVSGSFQMAGRPAGAIAEPGSLTPRSPGQTVAAYAQYAQNTLDLSCMCRPSVKQMLSSPGELRWKCEGPCRAQLSLGSSSLLNWVRKDSITPWHPYLFQDQAASI